MISLICQMAMIHWFRLFQNVRQQHIALLARQNYNWQRCLKINALSFPGIWSVIMQKCKTFFRLSVSMNSEPVETRIINVSVIRKNIQLDVLKSSVVFFNKKHLNRFSFIVIRKTTQLNGVRILLRTFESVDDEIFRGWVDITVGWHWLRDVFNREFSRAHWRRELDDQVTLRSFECPALSWQHTGLKDPKT